MNDNVQRMKQRMSDQNRLAKHISEERFAFEFFRELLKHHNRKPHTSKQVQGQDIDALPENIYIRIYYICFYKCSHMGNNIYKLFNNGKALDRQLSGLQCCPNVPRL